MLIAVTTMCVLIASATSFINDKFSDNALFTELVKCTINGSCANRNSLLLQVSNNISYTDMRTAFLQKIKDYGALPCVVFCFHSELVVNRILFADFCNLCTDIICLFLKLSSAKLNELTKLNHILLNKTS